MLQENTGQFLEIIEEKLSGAQKNRMSFAGFLEEKMDSFDYSNTSLAKKVFHKVEKKGEEGIRYIPVTRQTIGAWLKGSMPSSREIYITLGMAFHMNLEEINAILLKTYMGYGLYCKNIDDALWIALINGLFDIEEMEDIKRQIEEILEEPGEPDTRSLNTMDLWVMLSEVTSMEQFYTLIRSYKDEFKDGMKRFGQCLEEVIEEEYGYYEKAAWLLRDIGCLHCEAQFSKIKAGKAVVTREWLLRFCIALQPTYESIEKLLAKAQMEPLGITPAEIILEMIARYKSDSVANSQEIWMMIESVTDEIRKKGYEIEDDLCRKYNSVYQIPPHQKWWFSVCVGKQMLACQKARDYGYEKTGYCRYTVVDKLLFDDMNRNKKSSGFKKDALNYANVKEYGDIDWEETECQEIATLSIPKGFQADLLDLEKFEDYCFMRKPSRFSKDFLMNDNYFYSALLYSIWTGKCDQRDFDEQMEKELRAEFDKSNLEADGLLILMKENLKEDAVYQEKSDIKHLLDALWDMRVYGISDSIIGKNE